MRKTRARPEQTINPRCLNAVISTKGNERNPTHVVNMEKKMGVNISFFTLSLNLTTPL